MRGLVYGGQSRGQDLSWEATELHSQTRMAAVDVVRSGWIQGGFGLNDERNRKE